jgi:hypothetical protein
LKQSKTFKSKCYSNVYFYTIKIKKPNDYQGWRYECNVRRKKKYRFSVTITSKAESIFNDAGEPRSDMEKAFESIHLWAIQRVEEYIKNDKDILEYFSKVRRILTAKEHGPVVAQIKNV